jgi:hypothetical protein
MKRRRLRPRNEARQAHAFARNFGSSEYVEFTRREPCLFCRSHCGVRTAHLLHARGMGGCGGSVGATGPVCFACDIEWGRGQETFLRAICMSRQELERRVRAHHERFAARRHVEW